MQWIQERQSKRKVFREAKSRRRVRMMHTIIKQVRNGVSVRGARLLGSDGMSEETECRAVLQRVRINEERKVERDLCLIDVEEGTMRKGDANFCPWTLQLERHPSSKERRERRGVWMPSEETSETESDTFSGVSPPPARVCTGCKGKKRKGRFVQSRVDGTFYWVCSSCDWIWRLTQAMPVLEV